MTEIEKMKAELNKLQKKPGSQADIAWKLQAEITAYQTTYQEFKRLHKWVTPIMWDRIWKSFPKKQSNRIDLVQAKRDWREFRDELIMRPFDEEIAIELLSYYEKPKRKK